MELHQASSYNWDDCSPSCNSIYELSIWNYTRLVLATGMIVRLLVIVYMS
jgi:hypothetical protein